MLKWILWTTLLFWWLGFYLASSNYVPISKQIDVKTMQIKNLSYITKTWDTCVWSCVNRSSSSSSSSWGWWSSGWK